MNHVPQHTRLNCVCTTQTSNRHVKHQYGQAAGLDVEAPKTVKVGKPAAPTNLRAKPTDKEGEVKLMFVRPVRRCVFSIECRRDDEPDGWKLIDSSCRQIALIEGLQSGVKYWFRVSATNAHGTGPWSNLATARVK